MAQVKIQIPELLKAKGGKTSALVSASSYYID